MLELIIQILRSFIAKHITIIKTEIVAVIWSGCADVELIGMSRNAKEKDYG